MGVGQTQRAGSRRASGAVPCIGLASPQGTRVPLRGCLGLALAGAGDRCAVRRRGAGRTWEGAERSGVGAQGPVAHPRHELQAEDLLHEPGRPAAAAAAPLGLHPAAIHRPECRGARHLHRHGVTFGRPSSPAHPNGATK